MTEQDQQALDWSKANPNDPRSKNIQAKLWAKSNPEDPRASQILDRLSAQSTQVPTPDPAKGNPFDVAGTQQAASKQVSQDPKDPLSDPQIKKTWEFLKQGMSPEQVNKIGANALLPGMGAEMASGAGALSRLGIGTAMGATQGAMKPDGDSSLNALGGAATGLLGGSALEGLGSAIGGLKGASQGLINGTKDAIKEAMEKALQVGNSKGTGEFIKNALAAKTTTLGAIPKITAQTAIQGAKGAAQSLSDPSTLANDPRTLSAILNAVK